MTRRPTRQRSRRCWLPRGSRSTAGTSGACTASPTRPLRSTTIGDQVLPFETDGVDRVIFLTGFENIASEYFEKTASSQQYKPSYALTSDSDAADGTNDFTADAISRVQGVGWEPDQDATQLATGTASRQRCQALFAGYSPAQMRANVQNNDSLLRGVLHSRGRVQGRRCEVGRGVPHRGAQQPRHQLLQRTDPGRVHPLCAQHQGRPGDVRDLRRQRPLRLLRLHLGATATGLTPSGQQGLHGLGPEREVGLLGALGVQRAQLGGAAHRVQQHPDGEVVVGVRR